MKTAIKSVLGRRIWDSRGRPTIEVEIELTGGARGRGIAPAGASRGTHEAIDLRDGGSALGGFGVSRALANISGEIASALKGKDARDQKLADDVLLDLDRSPTKSRLGGNATIATSMAVLHAAAASEGLSLWRYLAQGRGVRLPLPQVQIFGGGAHAGHRIDIQDLLVIPIGAKSFDEAMVMVAEVYRAGGAVMAERGSAAGVADEGGWWPNFASNEEALDTLTKTIERAGYRNGEVMIALDIAASQFRRDGKYKLTLEKRSFSTEEWVEVLVGWTQRYPILSVEDAAAEDDATGMKLFTKAVGARIQVIGDDFLVTNATRVGEAQKSGACNAILIKPNQAGTITETHNALLAARAGGWGTIVSARSGETEDTTIVHLAVGWDAGQLKVGSFARSERMAKWNEGLRVGQELGAGARLASYDALPAQLGCRT
jgi:enolase